MKPVNLLPPSERPRPTVAAPANASTVVMATLAVLLLAVAAFVFTKNQVTDRNADIAQAQQEQAAAQQRSNGLKAFGDFSQIKQTRLQSVTDLATQRFDWERFMRELALVLPSKVWLTSVTAGSNATGSGTASTSSSGSSSSSSSSTASSSGAAATGATSGGPSAQLTGCAPSQKAVAELIVRLRSLHGADDVNLQDSTNPESQATGGSADSGSAGSSGQSCGHLYVFNATVSFAAPTDTKTGKPARVPARLGGGS